MRVGDGASGRVWVRQCENTPGGYECNCIAGYQENVLTGNCEREWEGVGVRVGDGGSGRV